MTDVELACQVLNILFWKVPAVDGDQSGQWWAAELNDKDIPIRWDEESQLFCQKEE